MGTHLRELSKSQDSFYMVFKNINIFVLWKKVLEGLTYQAGQVVDDFYLP